MKRNEKVSNEFLGECSDSVPLFGYRRRSYLILSGLLGALSWTLMATLVDSKYGAAFCILLGSLSVAFSDVVSAFYFAFICSLFIEVLFQQCLLWRSGFTAAVYVVIIHYLYKLSLLYGIFIKVVETLIL